MVVVRAMCMRGTTRGAKGEAEQRVLVSLKSVLNHVVVSWKFASWCPDYYNNGF